MPEAARGIEESLPERTAHQAFMQELLLWRGDDRELAESMSSSTSTEGAISPNAGAGDDVSTPSPTPRDERQTSVPPAHKPKRDVIDPDDPLHLIGRYADRLESYLSDGEG